MPSPPAGGEALELRRGLGLRQEKSGGGGGGVLTKEASPAWDAPGAAPAVATPAALLAVQAVNRRGTSAVFHYQKILGMSVSLLL